MSDDEIRPQPSDAAWRPFEMAAFDKPAMPTGRAVKPPAAPSLPSAAELRAQIERVQSAAATRGHAEGYAAGHEQGLAAGVEEGRKKGYADGHEAGSHAAREEGRELARQQAEQLSALARSCAEAIGSLERETGQALVSLAVSIAERVLHSTLDAHPEKVLDLLRDIAHIETGADGIVRLRVHPDDAAIIQPHLNSDPSAQGWRLIPDAAIARGGCIAETALGRIDATLQTRWRRVTASLGPQEPHASLGLGSEHDV
jgi:flagellar assembly protein FliH